ncbi:MAG: hypothetical protein GAK45_00208 [Pseudomonas citronellolis]|nr:MAG: hypothetical protein GAK45_00208 [Pseudomonas citronellolis]
MKSDSQYFIEDATQALLHLVPSLAERIDLLLPPGATAAQASAFRQQHAWNELCSLARRADLEPMRYARQLIMLRSVQQRTGSNPFGTLRPTG